MDNYDNFISIGYVCNVVSLLRKLKKKKETLVFDRMGTPMWAITKLFKTDFANFPPKQEDVENKVLFDGSDKTFSVDKNNIRARTHVFYGALEHGMLHAYILYASSYDSKVRGMLRAHEFVIELEDVLVKLINELAS